jgi:2-(1,2-epoxy-1,2-dihydrophenyl)acetyl-CoA isomerase
MSLVGTSMAERGVVLIELADPATRNALTSDLVADLRAAFADFAMDTAQRVAILTGQGETFSSGGNTKAMGSARPQPLQRKEQMWSGIQALIRDLESSDKPVLAAINGPAIGAGADLAWHADIRFMAEEAWLRAGYVDLAVVPGAGAAWTLPRLVGTSMALELLWTGRRVEATEALAFGLVSRVVPRIRLLEECVDLAAAIAAKPQPAVRLVKRMVRQGSTGSLAAALDLASSHFAVLQESEDHAEALEALSERRPPSFQDR